MKSHYVEFKFTENEGECPGERDSEMMRKIKEFFERSPYSFEIPSLLHTSAIVEYKSEPVVKPGEDFEVQIILKNNNDFVYYDVDMGLPEGWSADYERSCYTHCNLDYHFGNVLWKMTIHVGEKVDSVNRIPVMFSPRYGVTPVTVPIVLLG